MAAPEGKTAKEAYATTKMRSSPAGSAADFVPKASPAVVAKAAELHRAAGENLRAAVAAQDPFRPTGYFADDKELPKGGRKSRRRKTRRRGGAMSKTLRELVVDLERDPSESTLRNVLTDLKESPNAVLRVNAESQDRALQDPIRAGDESMSRRVRRIIGIMLPMMRGFQYAGRRRKTTRRR
jgi:hypothetical protein